MNMNRLATLANHLRTLAQAVEPKRQFNLIKWFSGTKADDGLDEDGLKIVTCSTAACAIGEACLMPEFNNEGFHAVSLEWWDGEAGGGCPVFKGYRNWRAVEAFFNIDTEQAHYLFESSKYAILDREPTPNDVADRIGELLKSATYRVER